jgi:hypothetical protein
MKSGVNGMGRLPYYNSLEYKYHTMKYAQNSSERI